MAEEGKRRAPPSDARDDPKRKKQKQRNWFRGNKPSIEPGDSGIFITCNRDIERRCVGEVTDLFKEYVERLYGLPLPAAENDTNHDEDDIDAAIQLELAPNSKPDKPPLFENVTLDHKCLVFFRTRSPIDPVSLVHTICTDAANSTADAPARHVRFAKRLTPLSFIGPASDDGLESIARQALAPHFHAEDSPSLRFAIRPTIRDHCKELKSSQAVIKLVAGVVGGGHKVDLKGYEVLILVEVYRNVCGVSVVRDFEKLKRFNLSEIHAPTPKPQLEKAKEKAGEGKAVDEKVAEENAEEIGQSEADEEDGGRSMNVEEGAAEGVASAG